MNARRATFVPLILALVMILGACSPNTTMTSVPSLTKRMMTSTSSSRPLLASTDQGKRSSATKTADIVVLPGSGQSEIRITVGQTIAILPPNLSSEWQVNYGSAQLQPLTPPDKMRAPGAQGWLFRAVAPGETEIVLTSIAIPCQPLTPCPPPNPARFTIPVLVQE